MPEPYLKIFWSRRRLIATAALLWILLVASSFVRNWLQLRDTVVAFAQSEARSSFQKDLVYRQWVSLQGGVYVPPTAATPPNPYLAMLPDRDLVTSSGRNLTLVNPAYMTRQVHELDRVQYGLRGHITSLRPIRPENAPDDWETGALKDFQEKGSREVTSVQSIDGRDFLRFMRPMFTEASCLKCHGSQGYKVGEIRGGISVSVPMESYYAAMGQQRGLLVLAHSFLALFGLTGFWLGNHFLQRSEKALAQSEDTHRTLFRQMLDGFALQEVIRDGSGRVVDARLLVVNPALERILARKAEALVGKSIRELFSGQESEWMEEIRRVADTGEPAFVKRKTENGQRHLEITVFRPAPERIAFLLADVTELRQAASALQAREMLLREIIENSQDILYRQRVRGGVLEYMSPSVQSVLGYTPEEMKNMSLECQLDLFHPDDQPVVRRFLEDLVEAEARGERFIEREFRMLSRSGDIRWIHGSYQLTRDPEKEEQYVIGTLKDITGRKKADQALQESEARLRHAQKMESVGRLAGGVAHDFNNMLAVILGHTEMALDRVDRSHTLHADLQQIKKAADRSADLTRQLLAFARKQTIVPRVIQLNETVSGMLTMLRRLMGEDIHLTWRPWPELWTVRMDPSQIDQILANLCVNARDAIHGGGEVTIETGTAVFDEAYCRLHHGFSPGEFVLLSVTDNGCGMEKETLERLFEPFFTTKEIGRGTGLGLATVHGIVNQNGGFIQVSSEPGKGSTFRIFLPRCQAAPGSGRGEEVPEISPPPDATILLVEDEPALLSLTERILRQLGYRVLTAATPGAAVRLAGEHPGEINLLIADVIMPGMTGRELAQTLLDRYPVLKHLFMSGYTADIIAHHGVLEEGVNFIQKPFSPAGLARKVREALRS